jgi:hypothetical protein
MEKQMKTGQVAVFPLRFVRDSLKAKGKGTDYRLWERFGYMHMKRLSPAVVFTKKDLSFVHCGAHPLVACVEMSYDTRWRNVGFCYINSVGAHVYPG